MRAAIIVKLKVGNQPNHQFWYIAIAPLVNILVLHTAPKPLHEDVIQGAAMTVHADLYTMRLKQACKRLSGEL